MLRTAGVETSFLTRFQTEATGDEGERVDLVCYDEHGTERVLIEAKFWAGLTDNQPNTYLARLSKDSDSALVFVAPAQRIETLWPELCRRAEEQHKLLIPSDSPTPGELRGVSIDDNGHKMMVTSWRYVLERMESQASIAGDREAARDIEQLRGLTERMDSDAFLPIHPDELGPELPRRLLNLNRLVDDATNRAIATDWAESSGRATPQRFGYGRYFRLDGVVVWFGVHFQHWAETGQTPLWLQPQQGDYLWRPIDLPTGVEYPTVVDLVVDHLDLTGQQLKDAIKQ